MLPSRDRKGAVRFGHGLPACILLRSSNEHLRYPTMSEKVAVFDTTLRDGEQAAGTRLGSREKLILARQLAQLNVDVIEAGYPNSSPEDFEAVQLIGREIQGTAICALS